MDIIDLVEVAVQSIPEGEAMDYDEYMTVGELLRQAEARRQNNCPRLLPSPIMTPLQIEVLLHFNATVEPHPRADAPAVAEALRIFSKDGMLSQGIDGERYFLTKEGQELVKRLCSVPWPE